jgi:arginase
MLLRFALIDAPSPLGVGPTGVERLAEALRAAGLKEALKAEDGGAVRVPPHDPRRDPDTLLLNPSGIRDFSQRLADSLGDVLDRGRFPVVLGGDCNILIGDMLALRRRGRYGLFFLDGHADFYQPEASPTGAVSDMDLAIVTGYGPAELSDIEGRLPLVREEDVVVFGYRDAEEAAHYGSQDVRDTAIDVYDLSAVQALGAADAAAQALDRLLSRNWWWKLLSDNELEVERLGFFFEPFNALESELLFVILDGRSVSLPIPLRALFNLYAHEQKNPEFLAQVTEPQVFVNAS